MATAQDILRLAAAEIGYSRWNDPAVGTKYGRDYAKRHGAWFGNNGVAYCDMFVTYIHRLAGYLNWDSAYVPGRIARARSQGYVLSSKYSAAPGDCVCFDWDGDGVADHIGFVELNRGTSLQTIEGNTSAGTAGSQSNGGVVARRSRSWGDVICIIRYPLSGAATTGNTSGAVDYNPLGVDKVYVKTVQEMLRATGYGVAVDGVLGKHTFEAIKIFQYDHGLEVDGLPGPKTVAAMKDAIAKGLWLGKPNNKPKQTQTVKPVSAPTDYNYLKVDKVYVRTVQEMLRACGYGTPVDGFLGKQTFEAIRIFQYDHGLTVDGKPGAETVAKMKQAIAQGLWLGKPKK